MVHTYIHHISITIRSSFYTSSILLGRLAAPDPLRPLQVPPSLRTGFSRLTEKFSQLWKGGH